MDKTDRIKRRYNRNARFYDCMDWMISEKTRREVLGQAKGKILEVGVGTGRNLSLYPPGSDVTGIDFSSEMLQRARKRLKSRG